MTSEIDKYLKKVLDSSEFKNSPKYQKLLDYLVKSSLNGIIPKEVTIAYDVYNIEFDNTASGESNIRVYVYSLRKKLDLYYANEGKDDKIHFIISKGAYKVDFIEKQEGKLKYNRKIILVVSIISFLLITNILSIIFNFKSSNNSSISSKFVWKDVLTNDLPVLIVVGDYYLMKDNTYENRIRFIRDSKINTDPDFASFTDEYPQFKDKLYKTKHTLLGKYAPICVSELTKILTLNNRPFDIILASDFQWSNIQNFNIIYVGSFKSLGIMNELLKKSNFEFHVAPNELRFHKINPDSTYYFYSSDSDVDHAYESDYSIVTKLPGTNNTNILFFLSTRDIGLIAAVKYFTNSKTLDEFEKTYNSSNTTTPYFESCFKILGLQRNTRSTELLHVNQNINFMLKDSK